MRRIVLVVALAVLGALPAVSSATATQRLYLLGSTDDPTTWYGSDPSDPELAGSWTCTAQPGPGLGTNRCQAGITPGGFSHFTTFYPRVLYRDAVTWNAASPMRFHVAVEAQAPAGYQVRFSVQNRGSLIESAPATEVSPGIFEGTLAAGGPILPGQVVPFSVEVTSTGPMSEIEIGLGGASWIEIATDARIDAVPALIAADTTSPSPVALNTPERSLTFNDDDWTHTSFTGTLHPSRTHSVTVQRPAVAVLAWLEGFVDPVVSQAVDEQSFDERKILQFPRLQFIRNGTTFGTAERTTAAMNLEPGPLQVRVYADALNGYTRELANGLPYTLHILQLHGLRTLRSMRWDLPPARWNSFRVPVAASCPYPNEPIPQTGAASTFNVDLDTHAATPGQRWTLAYELPGVGAFPCGEAGTDDSLRITLAGPRLWYMGPTPHPDATFHSAEDVTYTMTVTYTYDPEGIS